MGGFGLGLLLGRSINRLVERHETGIRRRLEFASAFDPFGAVDQGRLVERRSDRLELHLQAERLRVVGLQLRDEAGAFGDASRRERSGAVPPELPLPTRDARALYRTAPCGAVADRAAGRVPRHGRTGKVCAPREAAMFVSIPTRTRTTAFAGPEIATAAPEWYE